MTTLRGVGKKEVRGVGMARNRSTGSDSRPALAGENTSDSVESDNAEDDNAEDVETAYFDNLPALRRYVNRLLNSSNDVDADDIIQEVYVRAFVAKKTEKLAYAKAYLFRIARNLTFKTKARNANPVMRLVEDLASEGVIDNIVMQDEQLHQKRRLKVFFEAVSQLPPKCRQVFMLRQIDRLSHREISKKLGISTSTVEKHIAKGLRVSMKYMSESGYDVETATNGARAGLRQNRD